MKKITFIIGIILMCCILAFSSLVFLANYSEYYLATNPVSKYSSSEENTDNTIPLEVQKTFDYCNNEKDNLTFISVVGRYMDTVPKAYHTWTVAPDGKEREKQFYISACSLALQAGRPLSSSEVDRLAYRYIDPKIELIFGLVDLWWLWLIDIIVTVLLVRIIIKKQRQNRVKQTPIIEN